MPDFAALNKIENSQLTTIIIRFFLIIYKILLDS